jgi:hypothetical protein
MPEKYRDVCRISMLTGLPIEVKVEKELDVIKGVIPAKTGSLIPCEVTLIHL